MTNELLKSIFIETLKAKNTIFDDFNSPNENTVTLKASGENLDEISIYITFSVMESGAYLISIGCYDLPNFSKHYDIGVKTCNQLNDDELVKYYIDEDGDAVSHTTLLFNAYSVTSDFSAEQVLICATMMATSVDDTYPILEKAKWAN